MKVRVFQHVPFEGLGAMQGWLAERGATIQYTRFFDNEPLPDGDHDLLIVMGGPMSVNDEGAYPWLADEKRYLARAIQQGLPVLGVCLGAQLIASALGARVYKNAEPEIGWFNVQGVGANPMFQQGTSYRVFQWHGETFDLPSGAEWIATSEVCRNQAFAYGRAVALQFHLEATPESAKALVEHCRAELVAKPYVQSEAELLAVPASEYAALHETMRRVLARMVT